MFIAKAAVISWCNRLFFLINKMLSFQRHVQFLSYSHHQLYENKLSQSRHSLQTVAAHLTIPFLHIALYTVYTKSFLNDLNCVVKIWPSIISFSITYDRHIEAINFFTHGY